MDILQTHRVRVQGQGARVVLLCQNFGSDQIVWNPLRRILEANYRVITFDHMGSPMTNPNDYSYRRYQYIGGYVDDVVDILRSLRVDSCVFVGHSLASMIGVIASASNPGLFSKLVMINPTPRYLNEKRQYIGGFTEGMRAQLINVLRRNLSIMQGEPGMFLGAGDIGSSPVRELSVPLFQLHLPIALHLGAVMFDNFDARALLSRVTVPCYILQSEVDQVVPRSLTQFMVNQLRRVRPVVRYLSLDPQNHTPHILNAGVLGPELVEHIDG